MSINFITKLLVLLLLPLLFTTVSCNKPTEPPPPENYALEIIAVDASCSEVWLEVKSPEISLPKSFTLTENGEEKGSVTLDKSDTTIIIENLLPKKSYKYQLKNTEHKSNQTEITTLDTTSHNFTWQTFEFGEHGHSVLYDVAIIDENNIWAVGEIYMNDANGNRDPKAYNAVHWDGNEWKLKRITVLYKGNNITPTLYGVFAFSPTDIWFSSGVPIKGDGDNWTQYHLFDMGILSQQDGYLTKVWGSSSNDVYYVGTLGTIAHWNGSSWKKIESGTDVDLLDVWGSPAGKTVWACGYKNDYSTSTLLRIEAGIPEIIYTGFSNNQNNGYFIGPISGIWSNNNYRVYMMNWDGIYLQKNDHKFYLEKEIARFSDVGFGIDGSNYNNIFVCGEGFIGHWNGISYKEYPELLYTQRIYKNIAVKLNIVCTVGMDYHSPIYRSAVIVLGK